MKNRRFFMILIFSLAMNAAFVSVAGYGYYHNRSRLHPGSDHPSQNHGHFYEALGLTPAQLTKIGPMAATFHEQLNRLHADMAVKKVALITLLRDERTSRNRIETLRREMAAIQDGIQKTVIAHILQIKTILNARQRERFFDLLHKSMIRERNLFDFAGEG